MSGNASRLHAVLQQITPPDEAAGAAARRQWDNLAKPLGGLGLLETAVERMAALTGDPAVEIRDPVLAVFCGDHGVTARGVSQTDSSVTAAVARSLGAGTSTVCHMAREAECRVIPVDVGIADFSGAAAVRSRHVRGGTADMTEGPAMERPECIRAVEAGMETAAELARNGSTLCLAGEMGIGNTTAASAVLSVLLDLPPEEAAGRGAGLSDAGLRRKIAAIRTAVERNRPNRRDPLDVLAKVGGLELAALCGFVLGGARYRVPVVLDGFVTGVSALCAVRMCPAARKAVFPSHVSGEAAAGKVLDALELSAPIASEIRLGEGTGAVLLLPLLRMALAVYHSGHTFDTLGIAPYVPQRGG